VNKVKKYNRFLKVDQFSLKFYFEKTGIKKIEKCVIKKNNLVFIYNGCSFKFPVKVGVEESIVNAPLV
jgi:hypothetical protein